MRAFGQELKQAWDRGEVGPTLAITNDVLAIPVPLQFGSMVSTLCYALLEDSGDVHLIDPGLDTDASLEAIDSALAAIDRSLDDVRTVVVTHFHPDHIGLAPRIRDLTGATVILSRIERGVIIETSRAREGDDAGRIDQLRSWGVPDSDISAALKRARIPVDVDRLTADRTVDDGERLVLGSHNLRVVLTPGHTSGHICLVDEQRELVYAGDHLLPRIFAGIGLGVLPDSDPLDEFLTSLDAVEKYSDFTVLPGHEYPYRGVAERVQEIRAHHLQRTHEVAELIPQLGDATVWEYAEHLTWSAGWEMTRERFLDSALRQTALHLEFNRSGRAAPHLEKFLRTRAV